MENASDLTLPTDSNSNQITENSTAICAGDMSVKGALTDTNVQLSSFEITDGILVRYSGSCASVNIPSSVIAVGASAFENHKELERVTFPAGLKHIGFAAFCGCSRLSGITLPEGALTVGDWAFTGCEELASVSLPEGIVRLGDWCFSGCGKLKEITLPASITYLGKRAFCDCKDLEDVNGEERLLSTARITGGVFIGTKYREKG